VSLIITSSAFLISIFSVSVFALYLFSSIDFKSGDEQNVNIKKIGNMNKSFFKSNTKV
jgi:hypothetical protein